MYFGQNLKFLRKRRKRTQDEVALSLGIKRSTLNNYENEISGPSMLALVTLSDYFQVAIDTMLRVDLSKLRDSQLYELEHGKDVFLRGSNIRILATTVDRKNRDNIELVSEKAKAGYLNGFSDPEYIAELPVFQLPFLSKEKKYRSFQIDGDSMLPIPSGAWVTGEFVQDWIEIKNGKRYIVLTLNEGLVFKQIENNLQEKGSLRMISTNSNYAPYDLPVSEIQEIWRFVHYISTEVPEQNTIDDIGIHIIEMKKEIGEINKHLRKRKS